MIQTFMAHALVWVLLYMAPATVAMQADINGTSGTKVVIVEYAGEANVANMTISLKPFP
jgi:hypothetical protein